METPVVSTWTAVGQLALNSESKAQSRLADAAATSNCTSLCNTCRCLTLDLLRFFFCAPC